MEKVKVSRDFLFVFIMAGTGAFSEKNLLIFFVVWDGIVYAYIPQQQSLCDQSGVICNSDYGFSLGRGKFSFASGK